MRPLTTLRDNSLRKASLTGEASRSLQAIARTRLLRSWILGQDRFLVITVVKDNRRINGTLFVHRASQRTSGSLRTRRSGDQTRGNRSLNISNSTDLSPRLLVLAGNIDRFHSLSHPLFDLRQRNKNISELLLEFWQ
jgi:hypothetical protein